MPRYRKMRLTTAVLPPGASPSSGGAAGRGATYCGGMLMLQVLSAVATRHTRLTLPTAAGVINLSIGAAELQTKLEPEVPAVVEGLRLGLAPLSPRGCGYPARPGCSAG